MYLNDGTSFDTYIEYVDSNDQKGAIGIEVKYTENNYPIGDKEKTHKRRQWFISSNDR